MPNRIVRDGANSSERVDALSPEAEVFYRRILNVVDDFGRYDGRISMLIARAFPLKVASIDLAAAERWLWECATGEDPLIVVYQTNGKRYIEVSRFNQQVRAKTSKWPAPGSQGSVKLQSHAENLLEDAAHVALTCAADAKQVISDAEQMPCVCALNPESESESETKSKTNYPLPPRGEVKAIIPRREFLDEIWGELRSSATSREVLQGGPTDWDKAYFAWKVLDSEQKMQALGDVRIRDPDSPEMRSLPQSYVRDRKWQRPVQKPRRTDSSNQSDVPFEYND